MFIELHLIQSFAPSNLNRDDTNNPKDCEFGGVRRLRVSSQCFKRAMRQDPAFAAATQVPNGVRTRLIVTELRDRLLGAGKDEAAALKVATEFARAYSSKKGQMDGERTKVLLFLSAHEQDLIARYLLEHWGRLSAAPAPKKASKKKATEGNGEGEAAEVETSAAFKPIVDAVVKETKGRTSAPDIALFGRMLADKTETNIDAACQVAHAISTHAMRKMDLDYFTAVDDLQPQETTGAGMIGTAFFASACLYRYLRLNWNQLVENFKDAELARNTVEGFLRAAEAATPSGKQNSHAAHSRPSFMLAIARTDKSAGWSLVNAFERPVRPRSDSGLIGESVKALDKCWQDLLGFYGPESVKALAVAIRAEAGLGPEDLSESLRAAVQPNFEAWVGAMMAALPAEAMA